MALATQCPHCHTTFRVAHDQLKLRAGLVRCGSCKEIFNGIEHLLPSDTVAATRTPASSPAATAAPIVAEIPAAAQTPAPILTQAPAPSPAATPAPDASEPKQAAASDQLDFAYPDMGEDGLEPIADTVVEVRSNDPVEVEFIETPRKAPLPTPAFLDLPHDAQHGEAPLQARYEEPVLPSHEEAEPADGEQEPHAEQAQSQEHDAGHAPADPLTRMTLVDVTDEEGNVPPPSVDEHDPLDKVMEDFERKPARGKRKGKPYARSPIVSMPEEAPPALPQTPEPEPEVSMSEPEAQADADEPAFIKRERRKQTRGRSLGLAMNIGSALLVLLALGQLTYIFRDQLAARVPEARGSLQAACSALGCKVELPSQIETLLIEQGSNQLVALPRKDTSRLSFLLRNTAGVVQAWPEVELTLLDGNNVPLARRVFNPQEYLPAVIDPQKGFGANSEQAIEVYFEFADAKPEDYRVGVFYR